MERDEFYIKIVVADAIGMIKMAMLAGIPQERFYGVKIAMNSYDYSSVEYDTFEIILNELFQIVERFDCSDPGDLKSLRYWTDQIEDGEKIELSDEHQGIVILDDLFKDSDIEHFMGGTHGSRYIYSETVYEAFRIDRGYVALCDMSEGYPSLLDFADQLLGVYMNVKARHTK